MIPGAPYNPITPAILDELAKTMDPASIITDSNTLKEYNQDASELRFTPEAVIKASGTSDIQAVMKLANIHRFPVTPRGGGSGLAGACLPNLGGIVLSLEEMNSIRSIDEKNFIMEVEPGTISKNVRDAAAKKDLFYPPDPAGMDQSTIGGNAATDAGGPACVKYGTTRDYILGLEAVLPDGHLIVTGVKTRKGVVGYDLTNLLVGSEGTLGIITSLTLKLIPMAPATQCIMAVFKDMVTAMDTVSWIMNQGHLPSAIEFMDHKCLGLVGNLLPVKLSGASPSVLIIELDGSMEAIKTEMDEITTLCRTLGATHILPAEDEAARKKIWEVRRQVSLKIHDYAALYISEDVAVPLSAIAALVEQLPDFEKQFGLEIFAFGHAGDGNIHLNITTQDPENINQVNQGVKKLLERVIQLDGTISGEHGIGIAKKKYIHLELSDTSLAIQQGIKQLFDPKNILNPGKIFP